MRGKQGHFQVSVLVMVLGRLSRTNSRHVPFKQLPDCHGGVDC
jgi:hypothetical protein